MQITREQARSFLIRRQQFRACGSAWIGQEGVAQAIRHLGAVQIDPIKVFERNHHQVLFNRVAGYRPAMLDEELYVKKSSFEYFCNALCVLPMEEYPYFAYKMHLQREKHRPAPEEKQAADRVLRRLKDDGASTAREFASGEKVSGWWDGGEKKTKAEKAALDVLHYTGQVMITAREGLLRRYDLPHRVVPSHLLQREVSEAEYRLYMLEKFLVAYGLSQTSLFRFGWSEAPKGEIKRLLQDLVRADRVVPVHIEGVKRQYYCHTSLLPELTDSRPPQTDGATFIAPLDNLVWDRDRLEDIFGFAYRWEVYVPEAKRKYGYYVLPVLFGDEFVGRVELKAERERGVLKVSGLWLEKDTTTVREAVAAATAATAAYLGLREELDRRADGAGSRVHADDRTHLGDRGFDAKGSF